MAPVQIKTWSAQRPGEFSDDEGDEQRAESVTLNKNGTTHIRELDLAPRRPRSRLHYLSLWQLFLDVILAAVAAAFLVFACLVFAHRDQPVGDPWPQSLLRAATYGPTVFPIVFAAIIGRFLKSFAAFRMERGSRVSTMEYLLGSRTVFSAVTLPLEFRVWHGIIPILLILWAFSPLGSQASLRLISTGPQTETKDRALAYLSYFSEPQIGMLGSAAVSIRTPINALFVSALFSSYRSKLSPRDEFGNVKVPLYHSATAGPAERHRLGWQSDNNTAWQMVSSKDSEVIWSSMHGIPINGLPDTGQTELLLDTAYVSADCRTHGETVPTSSSYSGLLDKCISRSVPYRDGYSACSSGAGYALSDNTTSSGTTTVTFQSFNYGTNEKQLMVAQCSLWMNYVTVQVSCNGPNCRPTAMRPAQTLPKPFSDWLNVSTLMSNIDADRITPLSPGVSPAGSGGANNMYFWPNFINATDPKSACTSVHCPPSPVEKYLADPAMGLRNGGDLDYPSLWEVGHELFSTRFTQLLNTYWIDNVGNYAILGNFNTSYYNSTGSLDDVVDPLPGANLTDDSWLSRNPDRSSALGYPYQYNSKDGYLYQITMGSTTTSHDVIRCRTVWFVVLLFATAILLVASIATAIINMSRKSPDILTNFSSLLRYNRYADIPPQPSLDDSIDISRRLRNTKVLFGNVNPDEEVGYAALAVSGKEIVVTKLDRRKMYS